MHPRSCRRRTSPATAHKIRISRGLSTASTRSTWRCTSACCPVTRAIPAACFLHHSDRGAESPGYPGGSWSARAAPYYNHATINHTHATLAYGCHLAAAQSARALGRLDQWHSGRSACHRAPRHRRMLFTDSVPFAVLQPGLRVLPGHAAVATPRCGALPAECRCVADRPSGSPRILVPNLAGRVGIRRFPPSGGAYRFPMVCTAERGCCHMPGNDGLGQWTEARESVTVSAEDGAGHDHATGTAAKPEQPSPAGRSRHTGPPAGR